MKRASVEMIYHLRCADCASAFHNLGRAIWRLHRSISVDVGLLPAPILKGPLQEHDFELHCLIQHAQHALYPHPMLQILLDSVVADATTISHRKDVWQLAGRVGIDADAARSATAKSAATVRRVLERVTRFNPIEAPAFLINDEHLLHGNASPAFLHDVLQTLVEPQRTTARSLIMDLSKWTS